MKRRVWAAFLAVCMLMTLMPTVALADGEDTNLIDVPTEALAIDSNGTCSGIQLAWYNDHKAELDGGKYWKVTIPSSVVKIGGNAFYSNKNLGNNKYFGKVIGAVDFSQATNLEEIGYAAFSEQTYLSGELDLSATKVNLIDGSAFRGVALTGVILPSMLESLGSSSNGGSAFTECKQLQYIRTSNGNSNATFELPSALKYIGGYTFRSSFAQPVMVKLPAGVETVGSEAFNSGNIKQVIVEREENYSNYNAKAVFGAGMAVFKSMAAYNTFASSISSSYKSNLTYPINLVFQGTNTTEVKLNKKSIQYELDSNTGFWVQNKDYTLPELSGSSDIPAGFAAKWQLDGKDLTNTTTLNVSGDSATATYSLALAAPTIEYTKNGEVQESNTISVELTKTKEQSVGVKVSHPLLKTEQDTDDEYVYILYSWWDVENLGNGSRALAEPDLFGKYNQTYKWTSNAEIPITTLDHARTGGGNEYQVTIYMGYKKGTDAVKFYNCGTKNVYVSITQAQEYTVAYDLNGGTAPDGTSYDNVIVAKDHQTIAKPAPTKVGYVFTGWSDGTNTYYAGQEITPESDTTLTAQWQEIADWSEQPSEDNGGKLNVAVDVRVNVNVADVSANVSDEQQSALSNRVRSALTAVLNGETPGGMTAEQAADLRALLNKGASSIEAQLTVYAELAETPTEDDLKTLLGDRFVSGETAQKWDLSVKLTTIAKSGENQIGRVENVAITETSPITFALTTGQNLSGKNVRVLFVHGGEIGTAESSVTDAAKGVVSVTASKFSPYVILSKTRSGGHSSSGTTMYPIKVADKNPSGGAVSVDRSSAAKGTTVTVTVTPDKGYELGKLTVTDKGGKSLSAAAKGGGKYTFVMPAGQVTVSAAFRTSDWTLAYRTCPKDETCPIAPFTDANPTDWYHDGMHFCTENKLMVGYSDQSLQPDTGTTRAMLCVMLWRLNGSPAVSSAPSFADVQPDAWYTEAIRWVASKGIAQGYGDGRFGPNDTVTREQMVTILYRYAKANGYDVSVGESSNILSYADADSVADYALPAMQWACGSGMVQGSGNALLPQGSTTRAQMATMMMRFCVEIVK